MRVRCVLHLLLCFCLLVFGLPLSADTRAFQLILALTASRRCLDGILLAHCRACGVLVLEEHKYTNRCTCAAAPKKELRGAKSFHESVMLRESESVRIHAEVPSYPGVFPRA